MESSMDDPDRSSVVAKTKAPYKRSRAAWRARYEGSFAQDLFRGLGIVEFGEQIIIFGACLLLTVPPLAIVLSAYAGHRIDDDIATHLGLSVRGTRVIEGLFKASIASFDVFDFVNLLLTFAGTIAVARSVEVIYERAFDDTPIARGQGWLRCLVAVVALSGVAFADGLIDRTVRRAAGSVVFGLVELVLFTLFFWWAIHFLLGGRETWRRTFPAAVFTGLFWIGLGVFSSLYFSSTVVDDSRIYGTIGVAFTLVTWFIAIGAVLALGAVVGVVWENRRTGNQHASVQ